jgi:hypothetical protein
MSAEWPVGSDDGSVTLRMMVPQLEMVTGIGAMDSS